MLGYNVVIESRRGPISLHRRATKKLHILNPSNMWTDRTRQQYTAPEKKVERAV